MIEQPSRNEVQEFPLPLDSTGDTTSRDASRLHLRHCASVRHTITFTQPVS
jgi:hypothetical protein